MGTCEQCRSLSKTPVSRDTDVAFRHDSASLLKAVEDNCYMCSRVWHSLSKEQQAITQSPEFSGIECRIWVRTSATGDEDGDAEVDAPVVFSFVGGEEMFDCDEANEIGGWSCWDSGQFALLSPSKYPIHEVPKLECSTDSEPSWETASQWIKTCCANHSSCAEPHHTTWAPTRLVDTADSDNKGIVRVVRSSTTPNLPCEPYVALSHCWGKRAFPVLHAQNAATLQDDGIPISHLPPNFQDAVLATRRLGLRYLWIDSLCIVQNSPADWQSEAPVMNKVYRNALLTLSAMASPDAYGGLFRARDPHAVSPSTLTVQVGQQRAVEGLLVASGELWEDSVRRAPLSGRAWVVQERVLAPRSLYFCRDQLFWECRELRACEVFPRGLPVCLVDDVEVCAGVETLSVKAFERAVCLASEPRGTPGEGLSGGRREEGEQEPDVAGSGAQHSPYEAWNDILSLYVRCALTKSEDKLVALSGVAKDFASAVGDEYVAGLWRRNLVNSLLWRVDAPFGQPPSPSTRPARYRAPTWSWASIDGVDTQPYMGETQLYGDYAQLMEVNVQPRGRDPTGEIRHACLHFRGPLVKTRDVPRRQVQCNRFFGQFYPDLEPVELSEDDSYFCLPLREEALARGEPYVLGLVLALVKDGEEEYRSCCDLCSRKLLLTRVGTFQCDKGEPLRFLSRDKPRGWDDWTVGKEGYLTWFPEDTPLLDFAVI